jgi:hypothetical protein
VALFGWPTGILPQTATPLQPADSLRSVGLTGRMQVRGTLNMAWTWTEVYPPFQSNSAEALLLLAAIDRAMRDGDEVLRDHPLYPVTRSIATKTVNGATQVGQLLSVNVSGSGFTIGDFIRPANRRILHKVTSTSEVAAGVQTLRLTPPIPPGGSPANGEVLGCLAMDNQQVYARLIDAVQLPQARPGYWVEGLTLRWITSVNA